MLIDYIQIIKLAIPLKKAITTNLHTIDKINALALNLYTKHDLVGCSFIYGINKTSLDKLAFFINEISDLANLHNAYSSLKNWINFWQFYRENRTAEEIYALAALDIAIWDAFGKEQKKSLLQLLNFNKINTPPIYGTTGWLSLSIDELIEECKKYEVLGINAFKIRLGHKNDYERVKAVRQAMGDNYVLMLDANQRYSLQEAIAVAKKMSDLNIAWLEEPVGNSISDLLAITQKSPIPIAIGENVFDIKSFENICKHRAANILQPDIIRCGGITGFIQIAEVINTQHFPLCNHLLPELSMNLLSGFSNAYYLEYDDLLPNDIYTQNFNIKAGELPIQQAFGTGIMLTEEAIKKFTIH